MCHHQRKFRVPVYDLLLTKDRYERYLNMDDEDVFDHLRQIGSDAPNLNGLVQRIVSKHFDG
jgi:hypothetical protein